MLNNFTYSVYCTIVYSYLKLADYKNFSDQTDLIKCSETSLRTYRNENES